MQVPRQFVHALIACALIFVFGCGDDTGTPDYSDQVGLIPPDQKFDEPDPYQPGKDRLSVDAFYEGGRTETIVINGFRTHYFIFGRDEVGRDTFFQAPSGDRLEGEQSDQIALAGTVFWGGGIIWDEPIDLSEWKKLFVSFKSSDRSFATFDLTLLYGTEDMERSVTLDPTDYGYTNDGQWHSLEIDLQDAIDLGFDPTMVRSPLIFGASGGEFGDKLLIDNLYLTKF
jgi:hypothetical protein